MQPQSASKAYLASEGSVVGTIAVMVWHATLTQTNSDCGPSSCTSQNSRDLYELAQIAWSDVAGQFRTLD